MKIIELEGQLTNEEQMELENNEIEFVLSKNFMGGGEITEIILYSFPTTLAVIVKIILARIKSNQHKSIKINGNSLSDENLNVEVTGVSEKIILKILEKYLK